MTYLYIVVSIPYVCLAALFSRNDVERLAKEVSTMLSFEHTNVMPLLGVCVEAEIPLLIMPFMSNGSVLDFVRQNKEEMLCNNTATEPQVIILPQSHRYK